MEYAGCDPGPLQLQDGKAETEREREEPELWDYHEEKIVRVLSQRLGGHDEAEVRAVLGKMFTNCGDLEVGPHQSRGCGYYPTYANMNHHCR